MIQSSTNPLAPSALAQPSAASGTAGGAGAAWRRWFIPVLLTVVALDQASKYWLFSLPEDARLPSWIERAFNRGVAFGMFDAWPITVFLFTLALIPALGWLYWVYYRDGRWGHLAFGLILGGALGNGWDRLMTRTVGPAGGFKGVRDFIYIDLHPLGIAYAWPNFNLADSAICVGFAILVALAMVKPSAPAPASAPSSSPDPNHPTASGRGDSYADQRRNP